MAGGTGLIECLKLPLGFFQVNNMKLGLRSLLLPMAWYFSDLQVCKLFINNFQVNKKE